MIIFPAIDIKDGKCVRLYQGDFATAEQVAADPLETARSFEAFGAEFLHMVDLDGAKDAVPKNREIFLEVAANTKLKIEVGGGIRDLDRVEDYLSHGIERVILGSAAVKDPEFVKLAVKEYGSHIVAGIDARNEMVAVDGWLDSGSVHYLDLAREMEKISVKYIIFTDIAKDGTLAGPNLEQLSALQKAVRCDIIASGGIHGIADIRALGKLGLYGAICGKSLYKGTLNLSEAIQEGKRYAE